MPTSPEHLQNGSQAVPADDAEVESNPRPISQEPLLPDTRIPLVELCARVHGRVQQFLDEQDVPPRLQRVQEQTRISLRVIQDALHRYSLEDLSLSYNGGKDCLVLLILYLAALHNHSSLASYPTIQSVYILSAHPFQEVEDFVISSSKACSLSLSRYAKGMKEAFSDYLSDFPSVKAIFVGTRRTDPHGGNLTFFDRTDHGWPDFMRVHPVIDWHYVEVWTFIRHLNIQYCPLYDLGYTSLGGTTDTHRNPALRRASHSSTGTPKVEFRPAYELVEDEEERLGRDWEKRGKPSGANMAPTTSLDSAIVDD